uniref:RecQ-mediated genome instability protein 1 n=1 Tax=Parascaris univalens TaxID=6257 RepID=A0A914ZJ99_PARUN
MAVQFVYNYFLERHIPVNDDWLCEAVVYVQSQRDSVDNEILAAAVYEQWIFSDIKVSTEPALSLPASANASKKFTFNANVVLQVNSVINIGTSLHSQFALLTNEFEDNSGFDLVDADEKDNNTITKARRMLLMELTDGHTTLKAIEYRPIRELSLLTCPGCKILLLGAILCRRNILLLTESNCSVLGGDDESLMLTNRPVEVMARMLGKDTSKGTAQNRPAATAVDGPSASSVSKSDAVGKRAAVNGEAIQRSALSRSNVKNDLSKDRFSSDWLQATPTGPSQSGRMVSKRVVSKRAVASTSSSCKPVMEVKPLADRESASFGCFKRASSSSEPSTRSASNKRSRPNNIGIETPRGVHVDSRGASVSKVARKESTASQFQPKRIKVEVCDEEVMVIGVKQSNNPLPSARSPFVKDISTSSPANTSAPQQISAEDQLVARYREVEIVSIADALSASRFALGSIRRNIVAVMREVKIPLRIADDVWTMNVMLTDHSCKKLDCIIAHSVLVQLIGLTPEEAINIRASKDKNRRKEGTLRLKSVQESMQRLDIVWEVEFYACTSSTPVVRRMETLAQKLGLIR